MTVDHRAVLERYASALTKGDFSIINEMLTDDYFEEYPQSGEIVRGRDSVRQIQQHYPGGPETGRMDVAGAEVQGSEQRWLMTPAFTLVQAKGSGDTGTATIRARYRDGSLWWLIILYRLRGGRLAHSRAFFAPAFDPPEWRSQWVELRPTDSPV